MHVPPRRREILVTRELLKSLVLRSPARRRSVPSLPPLVAANVVHAALSLRYFFYTPAVFDLAITACLVAALVAA